MTYTGVERDAAELHLRPDGEPRQTWDGHVLSFGRSLGDGP